mgnify:CR=1 FL=1
MDQGLYTSGKDFTVDSAKMLEEGKLIAVRTHTRFVHFPSHRHNFIEVLYVCEGSLINIIGGKQVVIEAGELHVSESSLPDMRSCLREKMILPLIYDSSGVF